jgi:TolB-like protein
MSLYSEIKRRKVVRVALVYCATAFAVLQAADIMLPRMGVPDWAMSLVVALAVLGLPIAMVLAWALELTPDGIRVTTSHPTADPDVSPPPLLERRTVLGAATLVVLGVGLGAGWFLRPMPAGEAGALAAAAGGEPAGPSITAGSVAVLPFADMSQAGDQAWFADGLTEEILNSLARLPELKVTARTSSFQFRDTQRDIRAIADTLGVTNVVEGSVRRIGDRLRVTAQLIRAEDGFHLWSDTYDRSAADLFEVQRDVAENIAATLNVFLDDAKRERMFATGTRSVRAFEEFRRGEAYYREAHISTTPASLVEANRHFARALALDSSFAQAALLHSDLYAHLVMDGPDVALVAGVDLTQAAAIERLRADLDLAAARTQDPAMRAVVEIIRQYFSPTWHRLPALLATVRAMREEGQTPGELTYLHEIQLLAGELDAARRFAERRGASDPLNLSPWFELVNVAVHRRDFGAARALIEQARATVGNHRWLRDSELLIAQIQGDRARAVALLEGWNETSDWHPAYLAALHSDRQTALRLAAELDRPDRWPRDHVLKVYHELGDDARRSALARRIDALPAGPAILARLTAFDGNALVFDLADTPNFAARLAEAGIDPAGFQPMPRLSVRPEDE